MFADTIRRAVQILDATGNRSGYARDVLLGHQRWSGADLKGKAKRFGASYARQRGAATQALHRAGGVLVQRADAHGLLVAAVPAGQDDYGTALYVLQDDTPALAAPSGVRAAI